MLVFFFDTYARHPPEFAIVQVADWPSTAALHLSRHLANLSHSANPVLPCPLASQGVLSFDTTKHTEFVTSQTEIQEQLRRWHH